LHRPLFLYTKAYRIIAKALLPAEPLHLHVRSSDVERKERDVHTPVIGLAAPRSAVQSEAFLSALHFLYPHLSSEPGELVGLDLKTQYKTGLHKYMA
jgi:hypothetical protein